MVKILHITTGIVADIGDLDTFKQIFTIDADKFEDLDDHLQASIQEVIDEIDQSEGHRQPNTNRQILPSFTYTESIKELQAYTLLGFEVLDD